MKHVKNLGLASVTAIALTVLVGGGSASATALYNGATKLGVGSTLDLSLKSGTKIKVTNTAGTEILDECSTSTIKGKISNAGGAGVAVTTNTEEWRWEGCSVPTAMDVKGGLEISWLSGTEGTVKSSSETSWTINTVFFGVCSWGVLKGTDLGKLTTFSSGAATFDLNATLIKLAGSNFACPETYKWTATYASTEPLNPRVEAS
jgi:hypothetical protein